MTEVEQVTQLLLTPAGFGVDLFSVLSVYVLEDGRFTVVYDPPMRRTAAHEEFFSSAPRAAARFIELRHQLKLGYDHEKGKRKESAP